MTIRIILAGAGGELDRHEIDCRDDDSAEVSNAIHDVIADWVLSPGDTITIEEI